MAIRKIVLEGDPILRKKSRKVEKFDERLHILLDDMIETMREANGAGLAAVQVGVLRRALVVEADDEVYELINPVLISQEGRVEEGEGCLSFPGEYALVPRPKKVKVRAQNRYGEYFEKEVQDLAARAFCHEIDHLNGKVFKDIAIRMLKPEELEDK